MLSVLNTASFTAASTPCFKQTLYNTSIISSVLVTNFQVLTFEQIELLGAVNPSLCPLTYIQLPMCNRAEEAIRFCVG